MQAREQDFFSAFVSISKAISSTLDLKEVLNLILKHAVSSLDLKAGAISLLDKKKNRLKLIANHNLSQDNNNIMKEAVKTLNKKDIDNFFVIFNI